LANYFIFLELADIQKQLAAVRPWTNSPHYGNLFLAFVALVLPFDSFEGLQGHTLRPFFAGWRQFRRLAAGA
jgi:hypothetical protein